MLLLRITLRRAAHSVASMRLGKIEVKVADQVALELLFAQVLHPFRLGHSADDVLLYQVAMQRRRRPVQM
jgi:hypothetical protein